MALTATIYNFDIDLSDVDRNRYESLALRVPRHPSESEPYLITRVLAYCLELTEGIVFSNGISDPEEPTLSVRDLTGAVKVWIEIGTPDAARLHKASKAAGRVAVYIHKDPAQWLRQLSGERIHRANEIEIYSFDRTLIAALAEQLDRRMAMTVTRSDGHLLVALDAVVLEGHLTRHVLTSRMG